MGKKFEKKTVFTYNPNFGLIKKSLADLAKSSFMQGLVREMAQHILECHAETDRLKDRLRIAHNEVSNLMGVIEEKDTENATLRSQLTAEREWISSETHKKFPVDGAYLVRRKEGKIVGAGVFLTGHSPLKDKEYTLILAEADFPVPPKPESEPLEVKVGKYHWGTKGKTCHILDIGQEYCIYRFNGQSRAILHQPISNMQRMMQEADAVFIGEGESNV